jgi:hypothetical protein
MSETAHAQDETLRRGADRVLTPVWGRIKLVVTRTVLWSYERGSWQYDLICLAIVALIFLTPRSWFRDRPTLQLTDLRHYQGLVELGVDKDGRRYIVDARLVESLGPMKLEEAINEILRRRLQKEPIIKSIDPIQDRNKVLLGYTVLLAP